MPPAIDPTRRLDQPQPPVRQVAYLPGTPRLAFERAGQGRTLVFLHGIGGNRGNWKEQLDHFARDFQVVAWDARGYGESDDYEGPCEFPAFSQDLVRLLDHLGVGRASFIGLSMGGRILMDFAARHPSRIDAMVIAASFPSFGAALTRRQREEFMQLRRAPLEAGKTLAELAPQLVASLAGPHATPAMRSRIQESIAALHVPSYLKTLESTLYFDRRAQLAGITAPTLLLYGEFDTLVTPAAGKQVQDLMPHARYQVIPGAGHLLNIEAPDLFNQAVREFLHCHLAEGA